MSVTLAAAVPSQTSPLPGFRGALQAAIRYLSWRVLGTTLAIMIALDAWLVVDIAYQVGTKLPGVEGYVSGAIINLLMAFCIMFTTLVADQLVARGAKRLLTYAWAVAIGAAAAAFAQWQVHRWLHLRSWGDPSDISYQVGVTQPVIIFFEYLIWASIIVFIYVNYRTALLARARMNAAQVRRADVQRRTLESQLQALQARVEPQFLFNTLAQVRALYEIDAAKGGKMLGDLIVYLRAALPHLRDSTSTLERELTLVGAYLNIMQDRLGGRLAFAIDVPQSARSAQMPPMIMLPLLDQALHGASPSSAGSTIRIAANASASKLRVEIVSSGGAFTAGSGDSLLCDIQKRLRAIYAAAGNLAFAPASGGSRALIEIPYEPTDGRHR
jgi:hypothetical protein